MVNVVRSDYPPPVAIDKFLGGTTRHTRRIEIYEQDGITRWIKDEVGRLKGGNVNVDSTRDERRTLDLVLDNSDGVLQNAPGEFWYDKIIKVFRGVVVDEPTRVPHILIISDKTAGNSMAASMRSVLVNAGYGDVSVNTLFTTSAEMSQYDIVIALSNATAGQRTALTAAYRSGQKILIFDDDAVAWGAATFTGETTVTANPDTVTPVANLSHPVAQGWAPFALPAIGSTTAYNFSAVTTDTITMIAPVVAAPTFSRIAAIEDPAAGGQAVIVSALINNAIFADTGFAGFVASAVAWLNPVNPVGEWETQIGEFMIDRISEPHFPHEVKITGRDYTKKCMSSKFAVTTPFAAGYKLEALISQIAANAGIFKKVLPVTGIVVGKEFSYERGASRWDAMKEIANAYNYDLYFTPDGSLTMTKFVDPSTTAPALYIETGEEGQIASYEKATTDTRIYNTIVVTGESSDSTVLNVYAIAVNDDPNSPTSVQEIGERVYTYTSSFLTTTQQCQDVADKFLAIHSLEEFELSFSTLVLPWLDAGTVLGFVDPNPAPGDPSTFLLTQLTLPLGLGPMSGGARRTTISG